MPLTRLIADALGVVTISLVCLLVLLGLLCVLYLIYFRHHISKEGYSQLGYFNRPWIIRITLILFSIWWGIGEIIRLSFLRRDRRILHVLDPKWQETVCKIYIVSNLGFSEPCLFLTIVFLLRAALQRRAFGAVCGKWNGKIAGCILLYCLPMFVFQLVVILTGPLINNTKIFEWKVPHYFTRTAVTSVTSEADEKDMALCTYPLLSIVLLGLYATLLTAYLLWLGKKMLSSVINKGLRKRVFFLILTVSSLLPLRVTLLGLSVLSKPEHFLFEALVFSAFFVLVSCSVLCICMLVYCPVADSLALRRGSDAHNLETGRRSPSAVSLIGNQHFEASSTTSLERNSDASTKRGSISFRTMLKDEAPTTEVFEELSLFSNGAFQAASPPGSPPLLGQHIMYSPRNQMFES